ncbi:MAG: preprotein translocase subunit SecG [Planctomycetes bacterium]|nr:preprotein translocase subunit SecG [Planctomycetota bacterium]
MYLVIIGSALLLIAVILLQEGKGGGFGDAFGGMGTETFGARVGGVNKFTASIAAFFLAAILGVHLMNRPVAPAEPELETAQVQPVTPTPSPFGSDANPFGNPDAMGGQPNTPPAPGLTPQQIAERQFQLFNSITSDTPQAIPSPSNEGAAPANAEGAAAPAAASNDPWSDPAWGLTPEESSLGALAPAAPAAAPAASESGTGGK